MTRSRDSKYYAVIKGRIDKPTIFSSWGNTHPRVTGCSASYKGFKDLETAKRYMEDEKVLDYDLIIDPTAQETTPRRKGIAFYAVAHGRNPGIREIWNGSGGAKDETNEIPGACHKRFRTKEQAESFIKDWRSTFAEVLGVEIEKLLDQGIKLQDITLKVEQLLHQRHQRSGIEELGTDLSHLTLQ